MPTGQTFMLQQYSLPWVSIMLIQIARRLLKSHNGKISFSQSGEDLIINFIFKVLKIKRPTYLDIGAHDPFYLSNTAFFYLRGCRGICIEPDPELFKNIKKNRKHDICLNVGIGTGDAAKADFFVMTSSTLNTFSKEEAHRYESFGNQTIEKVLSIPLLSINSLVAQHCQKTPDFLNLDVEGLDYEIIKSIDFDKFRPIVICVETMSYSENASETKLNKILDHLIQNNYMIYADTYINTIFVDKHRWVNRSV